MRDLDTLRMRDLVAIVVLTLSLVGCTTEAVTSEEPPATASPTPAMGASDAPVQTASSIDDLPATSVTPVEIETGIGDQAEPGGGSGFHTLTVAAGDVWLGSPNGLVRIDADTNTAEIVDTDRGASVSGTGDVLWRAGFRVDKLMRYDARTGTRTFTHDVTGPLEVLATPSAAWVGLHTLGRVLKLDIDTGDVLADTVVGSSDCCGVGDFAQVGDSIWAVVNKDSTMVELDPATGQVKQTVHSDAHLCDGLRYVVDALWSCWYTAQDDDDPPCTGAVRFDPAMGSPTSLVLPRNACMVFEAAGSAWVPVGDRLVQIDPVSAAPMRVVGLGIAGYEPIAINEALGAVWIYSMGDTRVLRIDPDDLR